MATNYTPGTRTPFRCTVGDRIRLIQMSDDPFPMEPGSEGTVIGFCDTRGLEQIVVEWDSGRGLNLIPGKDRFSVVTPYDDGCGAAVAASVGDTLGFSAGLNRPGGLT
jgi:hypothetical protein